jgi:acetate kinase
VPALVLERFDTAESHPRQTVGNALLVLSLLAAAPAGIRPVLGQSESRSALLGELATRSAAARALDVFCHRLKKYVGAYVAVLGRVDAIVFTAGVGENQPSVRAGTCAGLEGLGVKIDADRNEAARGVEARIGADGMPIEVLVVPTDEERMIASDTYRLAGG